MRDCHAPAQSRGLFLAHPPSRRAFSALAHLHCWRTEHGRSRMGRRPCRKLMSMVAPPIERRPAGLHLPVMRGLEMRSLQMRKPGEIGRKRKGRPLSLPGQSTMSPNSRFWPDAAAIGGLTSQTRHPAAAGRDFSCPGSPWLTGVAAYADAEIVRQQSEEFHSKTIPRPKRPVAACAERRSRKLSAADERRSQCEGNGGESR